MLVYYDILGDKEVGSDSYEETTPTAGIKGLVSKRIVVKEGEVDIGANAAAETTEEDESCDASEERTVINVVEASHLQKIEIDKKEFKTLIKNYFKKLLDKLNSQRLRAAGFSSSYEPSEDKDEAKAKEDEAVAELSKFERREYDGVVAHIANFKKNFPSVQKFIQDVILEQFDNMEFYTCEEGELGSCMLIPAHFVGDAVAPIFYLFMDGIKEKKE